MKDMSNEMGQIIKSGTKTVCIYSTFKHSADALNQQQQYDSNVFCVVFCVNKRKCGFKTEVTYNLKQLQLTMGQNGQLCTTLWGKSRLVTEQHYTI